MQRLLIIILVVIVGIGISIYAINQYKEPMQISLPMQVEVKDINTKPDEYDGKEVVVSGIITRISNGKSVYTLWHNNRMIVLNIPDELKKDLELNTSIQIEGIVRVKDNDIWIDVTRLEHR